MPDRSRRRSSSRLLAAVTTTAIALGGTLYAMPTGEAAGVPEADVVISPNPGTAGSQFQGWGKSLVWFANATGQYPEELREQLYDMVYGEEGLNLNVARYNFGGGRASDVGDYFRPGGAVPGFWAADQSTDADSLYGEVTTNYADRLKLAEVWDPENPEHYDWSQDAGQRWWLEKLAENRDDLVLEGFVNSPPYFMTNSGYTSGNTPSDAEQMRTSNGIPEKYAKYIVTVAEHLETEYGVKFQTLTPFNEPCNGYWGTSSARESDGITPKAASGKPNLTQEGAQICPGDGAGQQQSLIKLLAKELEQSATDAVISSNDETNPQQFNKAWKQYDAETKSKVGQINVHTYWDGGAREARDHSRAADLPLWMSETGGDFVGDGFNPLAMEGGLGIAKKMTSDLRQLQPEAYVLWQEVEDYYNMQMAKPKGENLNWGSLFIDFDCAYVDAQGKALSSKEGSIGFKSKRRVADALEAGSAISEVEDCRVVANQKYNTLRNFTHFINPGDRLIQTDDNNTTAAVGPDGAGLSLVYTNAANEEKTVTVDLAQFGDIKSGASAVAYETTQGKTVNDFSTGLVKQDPVAVDTGSKSVTVTVPAKSVTTLEIDGVSGVDASASFVRDGGKYALVGVQSKLALEQGGENGLRLGEIAADNDAASKQTWIAHAIDHDGLIKGRQSFVLESAADGTFAVLDSAGSKTKKFASIDAAKADPGARWYPTTEDGGQTWVFANGSSGEVLDVNGQSTSAGARIGGWFNSYGANQRWTLRDVAQTPTASPIAVHTSVGIAPKLPDTIIPRYTWGDGTPVNVTWKLPSGETWNKPGSVRVTGVATDAFGNTVEGVVAVVEVGPITATDPASVKVLVDSTVADIAKVAPGTVQGQAGTSGSRFDVPVRWDLSGVSDEDFKKPGVVQIPGVVQAQETGEKPVAATLNVIVAEATGSRDINTGCDAKATFTEPGYSAAATCNGDTADKAWSNWKSGDKNSSDTLTYTFPTQQTLRSATMYFYKDGNSLSFPDTVEAEYQPKDSDTWIATGQAVEIPDGPGSPTVTVPLDDVKAQAVRLIMTARPATHMIVSEVTFQEPAAGPVSIATLSRLTVNGQDLPDFDADTTAYDVKVQGTNVEIAAVPTDAEANVDIEIGDNRAVVTVTATDGTTKTYTVKITKIVEIQSVTIEGDPKVGSELRAAAVTDPESADLRFQWLRNGVSIPGATGQTYRVAASDEGAELAVSVDASAEGYESATGESSRMKIQESSPDPVEPGETDPVEPGETDPVEPGETDAPSRPSSSEENHAPSDHVPSMQTGTRPGLPKTGY